MSDEHPDGGATSETPGSDAQVPPTPPPASPYSPPPTPAEPPAPPAQPYTPQPPLGEPYGGQPTPPGQPSYGQQPPYGGQPTYGEQPPYGGQPTYGGQPPYGAQPPYAQPSTGDFLPYGDTPAPSGRGGRRGLVVGAGALVLALVAGVGVYAATKVGGGGQQPEEVIPASAFAFAKIDLDPAADQKVAIRDFASKFPSVPKPTGDDDIIDALLRKALSEGDDKACKVDYDKEVKPWLGRRLAFAGVAGSDGKAQPLLAVQVKDEDKAQAAFKRFLAPPCTKDGDDLTGLVMHGEYAVFGKTQADVEAHVKAADKKSLKDAPNFGSDLDKLDGNQVIVAWVDAAKTLDIVSKESPQIGAVPNAFTKTFKGRVVFGMHMESDYAEWYGQTIDNDAAAEDAGSGTEHLTGLPKDTVAAVAINGLEQRVTKMLDQVTASGLPVDDFLAEFEAQVGLKVRRDILPILGNKTAIALGNVPTGPDVKVGMTSKVKDPKAARRVGAKLAEMGQQFGVPLEADVAGDTFYLTTGGYLSELKGDKGLGDSPTFKRAMGDLGDDLYAGAYVDLGQLMTLAKGQKEYEDLQHFSAIGMSVGRDGKDAYFRTRLVVK